jgi:hypothetical protein
VHGGTVSLNHFAQNYPFNKMEVGDEATKSFPHVIMTMNAFGQIKRLVISDQLRRLAENDNAPHGRARL